MEYFKPMHIKDENDLEIYESYLKENFPKKENSLVKIEEKKQILPTKPFSVPQMLTNPVFSSGYLRKNQGKLLKVDSLIGNMLDTKIGILLDVGADYIAIKLGKSSCSLLIPTNSIKYITIIHDNDYSRIANI